jgi:hypothetical protein
MLTALYLGWLSEFAHAGWPHLYDAALASLHVAAAREGVTLPADLPARPEQYTARKVAA